MRDPAAIPGLRVTVMGLGVHGGGLASALFFARRGAEVTVTDLRGPDALAPSLERLAGLPVRYVLGRHDTTDFESADLVIKNPAVPTGSPFLSAARDRSVPVETDVSVFLSLARSPVIAVTGTKGKSTTASAIHHGLLRVSPGARLGGNITVSPLEFLDELAPTDPVVLELSSWQLGDLAGRGLLAPRVSVLTVLLPDHLDRYPDMAAYVEDKKAVFREQEPGQRAIFNRDDPRQRDFPAETPAEPFWYSAAALPGDLRGAWLEGTEGRLRTGPDREARTVLAGTRLAGSHNLMNLLAAGLALSLYGVKAGVIARALREFPGVEHRLELFHEAGGIRYYDDSTATIPHAAAAALEALTPPVVLVAGGTDKGLDYAPFATAARRAAAIVLLAGTATDKLRPLLDADGIACEGPFDDLDRAVTRAVELARSLRAGRATGQPVSVVLSPGCASFGMFQNEFDRGRKFKESVRRLAG
ncbi:MAG: UDP-N-acetylmuramoyl-L-alanine--D-glutamate ligase [Spirochaetes bacterium]|nr:UDP-N-acetylmuramoyl-L-alanine--D-glutamate ligase [Spirochaetota bacterium]